MQSLLIFLKTKTEDFCGMHITQVTLNTSQTGEKLSANWQWFVANISENTDMLHTQAHIIYYTK
jgi:hypothetical protein